jgi:hypothetical protein
MLHRLYFMKSEQRIDVETVVDGVGVEMGGAHE